MDVDSINVIMDEARDYWIAQTGKSAESEFDAGGAISLYCDFDRDELNEIAKYALDWATRVLVNALENAMREHDTDRGSIDSEELIKLVIEATMPVAMCVTRHRAGGRRKQQNDDEYITTVFAEAQVNANKHSDGEIDEIWPQHLIDEVVARFTPEDAFRVGVLCGQNG